MQNNPKPQSIRDLGLNGASVEDSARLVYGLSVDNRHIKQGELFVALPGMNVHGAKFAPDALERGAVGVLSDKAGAAMLAKQVKSGAVVIGVDNPRAQLAHIAAKFYGAQPDCIVAVTGTNGKTSIASFCRQIWEAFGKRAVNFGTIGVQGAIAKPVFLTTPEPISLHRLLADLANQAVSHCALEASSHGLAQHRLDAVTLKAGAFSNFSQDHLDYHSNFETYFEAKMALFTRVLPKGGVAVINIDDKMSARVIKIAQSRHQQIITVGQAKGADLRLLATRYTAQGQDIRFQWQGKDYVIELPLIGTFQAINALQAAALIIATGGDGDACFDCLAQLQPVNGRMQLAARKDNGATIYVDYAHTPDALASALAGLRAHVLGRLIVVFGAGGDRDVSKRALMGKVAAKGADVQIITDDNPRSEDPKAIRDAIMAGCPQAQQIGDRALAILTAIDALGAGDVLLIAGKGHETGQIIGDDVLAFNDAEQASIAVAALRDAKS